VATRLAEYEEQLKALAGELAGIGFMSQGSVVCATPRCGKPGCRCQDDPPRPHGPYWQWSRAVGERTLTRRITEEQAAIYKEWIANRPGPLASSPRSRGSPVRPARSSSGNGQSRLLDRLRSACPQQLQAHPGTFSGGRS